MNGGARAKWVVILLASVILALGGYWFFARARFGPWRPALAQREVATRVLGEHLLERFRPSLVLVVGNPFARAGDQSSEIGAFEKASVRGLEEGLENAGAIKLVYPELRPELRSQPSAIYVDPKTTTPLSYLVTEHSLDQLAQQNPGAQLIVSLIGVPLNVKASETWRNAGGPKLALIFPDWRLLGSPADVLKAFRSGKIAAAVLARPSSPIRDGVASQDYRTEFERRFILVTSENIDDLMRTHPQLF